MTCRAELSESPIHSMAAGGRAVFLQNVRYRDGVEVVEPDAEGPILIAEAIHVGAKIQVRQFPPLVLFEEADLPLIEAKPGEDLGIAKLLFGEHAPIEPLEQLVEMRITQRGEMEFLDVFPVQVISGLGEVLRPAVDVKTVGQAFADRAHVAAGAARCFKNGDVVAALHQFVGAAQPGESCAGDDHALRAWQPGYVQWDQRHLRGVRQASGRLDGASAGIVASRALPLRTRQNRHCP